MTFLRQWREEMNLKQEYVASVLDCSLEEYNNIESGLSRPTQEQSKMLERIFIIPVEKLLEEVTMSHDEQKIQNLREFKDCLKNSEN